MRGEKRPLRTAATGVGVALAAVMSMPVAAGLSGVVAGALSGSGVIEAWTSLAGKTDALRGCQMVCVGRSS